MEEIDLKELIQMFLERKFLILIVVLIFAIIGAVYTLKIITPKYEATTSLVLVQTGNENGGTHSDYSNAITTTDITLNSNLVDDYTEIAKSKIVANTVINNLKLDIPLEVLQENITVTSISDTELIEITVENESAEGSCRIANEVAKVFIEKVNELYKVRNIHVLDVAEIPEEPCNINLIKNIVIFSLIGAILVAGYVLLVNMLDTTVKVDTDIERALGLPVLASIVLTGDNTKKKLKTEKNDKEKSFKETNSKEPQLPFSNNVQIFCENNTNNENDYDDNDNYEEDDEDNTDESYYSYINNRNEKETKKEKGNYQNYQKYPRHKKNSSRKNRRKGGN